MKLSPVEELSLEVAGWGLLAVLTFFFHIVGFLVIGLIAAHRMLMFMFVFENTKGFPYDSDTNPTRYEQLTTPGVDANKVIDGTELGSEREGRL